MRTEEMCPRRGFGRPLAKWRGARRSVVLVIAVVLAGQLLVTGRHEAAADVVAGSGVPAGSQPGTGVPLTVRSQAVGLSVPVGLVAPSGVRVEQVSGTGLRVWWSKVPGAKSYRVYRKVHGKWKVVKTTSGLEWVNKKLPRDRVQRYRVVACVGVGGRGGCGPMSVEVSAITAKRGGWANVRELRWVSVPKELGLRDSWNVGVDLAAGRGKPDGGVFSRKVRFVSSNPAVVTVPAVGELFLKPAQKVRARLQAVGYGSTKITAVAHNGRSVSFWIAVRDLTAKIVHDRRYKWVDDFIAECGSDFPALAKYQVEQVRSGSGEFSLDSYGRVVREGDLVLPAGVESVVTRVLGCGTYQVKVVITPDEMVVERLVAGDWEGGLDRQVDWVSYRVLDFVEVGRSEPKYHWEVGSQGSGIGISPPLR